MPTSSSNVLRLSWDEVSARRLERNALSTPAQNTRLTDIARAMCGAHAQVMSASELSIAIRTAGATRMDVRSALWQEHSLVKTYGPRGTVHILPAQDLPMWCGALSATPYGQTGDPKHELLKPDQHTAILEGMAAVLAQDELTTDELTEALVERLGSWAGDPVMDAFQSKWPRWRIAQATAGVRGALCFGANRGNKVTFTNPRRWLPDFQPADERSALSWLVKRYLYAYGPATSDQFAKWLAVPPRWAADLFESLADELQRADFEGSLTWIIKGDNDFSAPKAQGVRLLPYFDAYTIGSHPRERLFPGKASERALNNGQAGNFPVLLIDGTVAGVWHQRRTGKQIHITVEPLEELTPVLHRGIEEQAERIAEILEGKAQLTIGAVTTGPHA
jgi:hypothetical protein